MFAAGTCLKAQEITIVLAPGYNWISYPNAEAMPIVEALGSFTPSNGDIIQSQFDSYCSYLDGSWRGDLTQFVPGLGYKYYSARSEEVEFVFAQPASNVVTTDEPTDITLTSAVVGGTVTLPEGSQVFLRGVCWGTEPRPDIDGDHTTEETGIGSFSNTLEDLNPNTTYYVRAYVIYDHGLAYGNELSFTTLSGIPVVTTAEVTDVTATTATCGGTVTDDGGLAITARGVCWSTSSNPTIVDAHSTDGTGTGNFSSTLTGLTPNTTYFVRAYATNSYVTVYGNQRSFTTAPLPSCTVSVTCNPTEGGTITGGGTYEQGQSCTLTATANEGYTFTNWTENGSQVSTQATYSFTVTSNRNLVANFVPNSGVPIGAVNGRFTINEEGDQVYFSQGNLQYTKSTQTWSFMEHQYDVIVTEGQDVGDDYANTDIVSHFCWGTSGYNLRGTETDYYYQPFNTYQESGDAYGPSGSHNLTGDYANGDWGVYNAISNGGNVDNYWRTLTRDEWYYLFTGRDDALSKWERGNIDGVNGVILLPDDWELPEGLTFNVIDESDYEANTYTLQQWETMQAAGAVFLPASGWRRGTEVSEVNNLVGYWSSTYEYGFSAHNIWIENYGSSSSHTVFNDGSYRYRGYAVRLVRDAGIVSYSIDAAPSPTEGGTVTGTGTFNEGASCTLTAMPNEGYTFVNWTENGVEVSTQATYSFTVTSNRNLVANFVPNSGVPIGAVNGRFTINEEGDQVYFSQGNLQYTKSTQTWSFMEHQYDVIVTEGQDVGDDYANTDIVSHFCWGTSGYNLRGTETDYYYQPFNTYQESGDAYGPSGSHNLTGDYANGDWGVYNAISNGGNVDNYWRTLTRDEWYYLFTGRDDALSKWERGNIDGVNGVILLPDDWELPEGLTFNVIDESDYEANTYTLQQWETMQAAGAVFLPASGWRRGTEVSEVNNLVGYWSSTYEYGFSAHNIWIENYGSSSSHTVFNDGSYRYRGYAVRLVRDAGIVSYSIDAAPSPTEGGTVTGTGTFNEGASCTLTAMPNEGYTFVNWTENGVEVSTQATYSFTVTSNRTLAANFTYNGGGASHEYVDLGLPSGTLWATCNVGADTPEGYGDYFAWGETTPKNTYDWTTYQYCNGTSGKLTKYCSKSDYGYNGFTDNLTTLLPEDDAATANWGSDWRMPTQAEWQELYNNTTHTWTTQNGVNGRLFTASNGNSLFLPAAGYRWTDEIDGVGSYGYYWASSLNSVSPYYAWYFYFYSYSAYVNYFSDRYYGLSVRAVRSARQN